MKYQYVTNWTLKSVDRSVYFCKSSYCLLYKYILQDLSSVSPNIFCLSV